MNHQQHRTATGVQALFAEALQHHQAGRLAEAEQIYRHILTLDSHHADSLHFLGVLAGQIGRGDIAIELINKAIAIRGDIPFYHNNLANVLREQGRLDDAVASYKRALALKPDLAEALNNMSVTLQSLGRFDEAKACCEQAIALQPDYAEAHFNLGNILKDQGKMDDALACFQKALSIAPDADVHINIGSILQDQKKPDEAVIHYHTALALKPDAYEALNNLGIIFSSRLEYDEAIQYYQRALILRPDSGETLYNLGRVLAARGRIDEAMACLRRVLGLKPENADAHYNLGDLLRDQGRLAEAVECYQRAIALKADLIEAHINLGQCLHNLDRLDEALRCYQQALTLEPNSSKALNNLGNIFFTQGKLEEAILYHRRALALQASADIYSNLLLAMVYAASVSPEELATTARTFGKEIADPLRRQRPFSHDRKPDRKLRIGYVSPDFREHPVNYFFEKMLQLHDRQKFELFAYSNVPREDSVTVKLKQDFDYWRDIQSLDDDEAADLIEADAIDILIDMAGHTADNRLLVFARKPAPIQVTWLGYPATTGMAAMDYRITDSYAEPVGLTEQLNTETLWRLPEIFCCYQAHKNSPAVIDHPPFEDNGYITFGCFNNFAKVTDPVLEIWAKILTQVPDSRLLLEIRGLESAQFKADVEMRLQRCGLPPERVILEPRKRSNQFVLYNRLDIALDPFPCAGGTTSLDTLWMGVPLITLAGAHFGSRMGVTILTNAGMPDLIAKNKDDYVDLAVNLARDKDRLSGLRRDLRQKIAASPLMNQAAFARNMEGAYKEMWRIFCDAPGSEKSNV